MEETVLEEIAVPVTVRDAAAAPPVSRPAAVAEFIDDFAEPLARGRVIGSAAAAGVVRRGIDRERVLSVDNGALRIQPLTKPRWGRAGIAYGPYTRRNGLAFGVSMLNGHNTSQTGPLPEGLLLRLRRWALGSETEPPLTRLRRWARSPQRRYFLRHLLQWAITGSRYLQTTVVDENLAIGWFPREAPSNPVGEGNGLLMHALGPECGELWARAGRGVVRSARGLQNVPIYYVVVLRERGAAYYAASLAGVPGLSRYPALTPIAIDPFAEDPVVYAGVHQSVLGQVGFRVDSRVYRTQVAVLPGYDAWFGSAIGADRLTGSAPLEAVAPERGSRWTALSGNFMRTEGGVRGMEAINRAVLELQEPAGLVHMVVVTGAEPVDGVELLFRVKDAGTFFAFQVSSRECALAVAEGGRVTRFPATQDQRLAPNAANSVQVFDDGRTIRLYLNGALVYGTHLVDERWSGGRGVGIGGSGGVSIRDFEAHPRTVPLPAPLDLGEPWQPPDAGIVVEDRFEGAPETLHGRTTPVGGRVWERIVGRGEIRVAETAARVAATLQEPCPGRTAYGVAWEDQGFADLAVEITPPGTAKGQGERGRGGVIFWQDPRTYITLSIFLDDWYGMSIAVFFYRDGYEELYDAIWSNIGNRVHWGVPYRFRVAFDGQRFTAYVNGEPVLHRALSDAYADWRGLLINRVGLVVNWEWGNDTGTVFRNFVARGRA